MAVNARVRGHRPSSASQCSGIGSTTSPARCKASSTKVPISQLVSPALAEAGYTGRMRSVRRVWPMASSPATATTSTTGLTIWRSPRYSPVLPQKMAWVPTPSCEARQGWLKNTICNVPVSSRTVT